MIPEEVIRALSARGVELSLVGADLRVRGPAGALTADMKATLKANKLTLIEHLEARSASGGVPRTWDGEDTELSFMQERMWYFSKTGLAPAYNVVAAYHLRGSINRVAMRQAINDLVARHAMLRAYIIEDLGRPFLSYQDALELELPVEDLSSVPAGERMDLCHDLIREEYFHDFDVSTPPLLYFKLFELSELESVLYCNMHHALTDAFSFSVIVRELAAGYAARIGGKKPAFEPLPIQFPDWIRWQRSRLSDESLATDLDYWTQKLHKPLPHFDLAPDYARKSVFELKGADFPFEIPAAKRDLLEEVARRAGATLYMALLASLKLAIHKLAGSRDLIIGTPVAGRAHPELRNLIGGFLNTLAVRTTVDPDCTLDQFLRHVRQELLGALAHQDAPFNEVVRSLSLPHDPSRTPVYQVSLNLWDISDRPDRWGNLDATRFHVSTPWTHAEFAMWLMNSAEDGINGTCTYSAGIFDRKSALRLGDAVQQFVDLFIEDSSRRVSDLSIVTDQESAECAEWNATSMPVAGDTLLHQLALARVGSYPDQVAISDGHTALTYGDLDRESTLVAEALRAGGIGRGDLVAVMLEREPRVLSTILGILRAGAGYLPLDPEAPSSRVAFILDDADVAAVACSDATQSLVPEPLRSFNIDTPWTAAHETAAMGQARPSPSDTAYVIYTSGSTGQPKGVEVTHSNVVSFLLAMLEKPGLTESDTVVAATTLSFDISVLELYLPLVVGARILLANREQVENPDEFIELLDFHRPSVVQATPSFWRMLLEAGWEGDSELKILCGGESLAVDLARRLMDRVAEIWNMYGPTETTVWSTSKRVTTEDLRLPSIPIGRPIANSQVLIMDDRLRPVPIGVRGELLIGGAGVSAGYLKRPELTAERFVEVEGYGRMYRTGDRARFRHDGDLELFGRFDWQIKVRGHRIEPGEIEFGLRSYPAVRDAVVDAVDFSDGDTRLVAWVELETPGGATPSELRARLRERLPDYMIPSIFVEVTEMPRTPNGKTDRKALPHPAPEASAREEFLSPRPGFEALVATTWKDLLQVDAVGRSSNFFELGGHSLLSIRAVAALERETGHRLDPRLLFFYSLEHIASVLEEATGRATQPT